MTEQWEKLFDDKFEDSYGWHPATPGTELENEIKDFIRTLLAEARREEREIMLKLFKGAKDFNERFTGVMKELAEEDLPKNEKE